MSKMSELSQTLDDLITCGETLIKTANEIRKLFTETTQEADSDTPKTARTKKQQKRNLLKLPRRKNPPPHLHPLKKKMCVRSLQKNPVRASKPKSKTC